MDWSFVEQYEDAPDAIFSDRQRMEERVQLEDIANKVGSYRWMYKPEFQASEQVDGEEHIGPTAQQIQQIPGLEAAVITDEQGNLKVDTNYLSLATFGLLAALARVVLKGDDNGVNQTNEELPPELPTTEAETNTGAEFPVEQNAFPTQPVESTPDSTEGI